jgi:hypothetical protein
MPEQIDPGLVPEQVGTGEEIPQNAGKSTPDQTEYIEEGGQRIPRAEAVKAYQDMQKWRAQLSERGRVINQREDYINQLEAKYDWLARLDQQFFAQNPGKAEQLRNYVQNDLLGAGGSQQQAAMMGEGPAPAARPQPSSDQFVSREEFENWQMQQSAASAWNAYRQDNQLAPMEEAAMRHFLGAGMIRTTGLSDYAAIREAHNYLQELQGRQSQQGAANTVNQIRQAALAGSTETAGRGMGGEHRPPDLSRMSDEQAEAEAIRRLEQGDYGSLE